MSYLEQARKKLAEKSGSFDKYATVMKSRVADKLLEFCEQDEEFAEAVAQGGSFADCMAAVAKKVKGNQGIEDLEAYSAAVAFYFPGAEIRCTMTIDLIGAAGKGVKAQEKGGIVLNLADFLI